MADPVADTLTYYDQRAADFAAQTAGLDLGPFYDRFLRHVRPGGRILDAGCGPGRDALAFAGRGHEVVAFDASEEIVRLARARLGDRANVHLMRFGDAAWRGEFDGIWTCASLLHVLAASFPNVALRLVDALRPAGAWYMSFKLGEGERLAEGRLFVNHTEVTLRKALSGLPVDIIEAWQSTDLRPGRLAEQWLNSVVVHPVLPRLRSWNTSFQSVPRLSAVTSCLPLAAHLFADSIMEITRSISGVLYACPGEPPCSVGNPAPAPLLTLTCGDVRDVQLRAARVRAALARRCGPS